MVRKNNYTNCKRNNLKIMLLVFSLFFFSIFIFSANIFAASTPWWNTSFEFRQEINVSTSQNSTPTNYQINLTLNSTNVKANFNWSNNCSDIRVLDNQTKLNYWTQSCNSTSKLAVIWVNVTTSFNTTNKTLHIYYGNSSVTSESNGSLVFDFFDDFSGDLSKWAKHVSPTKSAIVDGYLQISGATTAAPYGHTVVGSNSTYKTFLNGIIEGELFLATDAIAEMGFRGNYAANTGYKSRADARAGQGVSHLRPPYSGWAFWGGCTVSGTAITAGTWHPFIITVNSNTFTITTNTRTRTCTDSTYNTSGEISLQNHYGLYSRFDNIRVRQFFNGSINVNFGSEEALGIINFNFITPPSSGVGYILQNEVYNVSLNVSCRKMSAPLNCGTLNFTLRYNDTSSSFTNISTSSASPLWITSSPQSCNLNNGSSCIISWLLNGTGNSGDSYLLDVISTSNETFTFNQTSTDKGLVTITNLAVVSFNQSSYDFGSFLKNSGNKTITLSIGSTLGNSTGINVTCENGDCSRFTDNFVDGTNISNGNTRLVNFTCFDTISGNYNALYSVISSENPLKSYLNLSCNIEKIYGPITGELNIPTVNSSISVLQNSTFKINATVNCVGECGNITAYALYNNSINSWRDSRYLYRQNITLNSSISINSSYQRLLSFNSTTIGNKFNWSNNCNDIAFYTENSELSFWLESCNTTANLMDVWIKTDNLINSSGYKFAMYFGYVNSSKSNGDFVFDFFDEFSGSSVNLSKWNILFDQGWSVSGGELIGTNTNGIINSVRAFSGPIILESKTRRATAATNGVMSLGFYFSASNGVGIREGTGTPSAYTYRNNGAWSGATNFDTLANYHYNKIVVNTTNGISLSILDLVDGTLSSTTFANTVSGEYIGIGRRYDDANLNEAYNQRWDWIRTRTFVQVEPTVSIANQETLNIISTNSGNLPFFTLSSQPKSCNIAEGGTCSFEWLINATGAINSSYNVSVIFLSNYSNINSVVTEKAQITIATTVPPTIDLISPINNSKILLNSNTSLEYSVSSSDSNLTCKIYINNILNKTQSCVNGLNNYSINLTNGNYNWSIFVNNTNSSVNSSQFNFSLYSVPTAPSNITGSPSVLYQGTNFTVNASGSTDADGDSITYEYKFYNMNDSILLQNWSVINYYNISINDTEDTIRVYARALAGGNYSTEYFRDFIVQREIIINLTSPLNNQKIIANGNITLEYNVTSVDSNLTCQIYLNSLLNKTISCVNGINNYSLMLENGNYNWSVVVNNTLASTNSSIFNFIIINGYEISISKKLKSINTDMYTVILDINNTINTSQKTVPVDFLDSKMNSGSFSTIYNFLNSTSGTTFNGNIFGWNLNLNSTEIRQINYSITRNSAQDYYLLEEFVVGIN